MAGIETDLSNEIDGVSLKPLLLDQNSEWNDRIIYNFWKGNLSLRNQKYRLDKDNLLYDMVNDPGQENTIIDTTLSVYKELVSAKAAWSSSVASELPAEDSRPFVIGHPSMAYTQLPARDAQVSGDIERSNRWPNNSFYTNWRNEADVISWDTEVAESGDFEVEIYYTCAKEDEGSTFELRFGDQKLEATIEEAHDPPIQGADEDLYPRMESYVKDFKPLKIGVIHLEKGKGTLVLKPISIKGEKLMDFRLMMLKRVG